jgi:hypothetical protein
VKIMRRLSLIAALGAMLLAVPGSAMAQGWGGHPGGGWRGGYAPAPRVAPAPVPRGYAGPAWGGHVRGYAPARNRVFVPGYWGHHGGTRVWIGGAWTLPPYAGWFWVAPHWQWNGYQWVWQEGYWAPPAY